MATPILRASITASAAAFALVSLVAQQPATSLPPLAKDPGAFPLGDTQGNTGTKQKGSATPAGPAPRLADGRPDFGGDGAWYPGFSGNIAEPQWKGVRSADKHVDVPFLPWSVEVFNERVRNFAKDDPEAQCLPVGIPRYMFDPYPFEIVQLDNRVIFIFEGDNHPWRIIRMVQDRTQANRYRQFVKAFEDAWREQGNEEGTDRSAKGEKKGSQQVQL